MKILKIVTIIIVLLIPVVVALAPIGPLPGFFIGGNQVETPASWGDTGSVDEVRLKVSGALPRVVIIWVIQFEGELYVVGSRSSGWVKMLGQGGPVALRLVDQTYELNATRVLEGWEPVMQAYIEKYEPEYPEIIAGFPAIEEAGDVISVFKLSRS